MSPSDQLEGRGVIQKGAEHSFIRCCGQGHILDSQLAAQKLNVFDWAWDDD